MKQKDSTVHVYEEAIRQNIVKKDWQKLTEVMIGEKVDLVSQGGAKIHVSEDC